MVRALRVMSVERGLDPRELALVAFGGAGGMHACALAEELGIGTILAPRAGGVLSALGLAISDLRRDYLQPLLGRLDELDPAELAAAFERLEAGAARDLDGRGRWLGERQADLRYRGQSFELTVAAADLDGLEAAFHAAHERRYGFRMDGEPVELVHLRLVATVPGAKPRLRAEPPRDPSRPSGEPPHAPGTPPGGAPDPSRPSGAGRRQLNLDGAWREVALVAGGALGPGERLDGPAVVEFPEATLVVRPGWGAVVDEAGTLLLARR
jgi:N-methylhydantoinase A